MGTVVTEMPRETRVLDAVVALVDSLLDDFDVVDLLTELTERCAALLDVAAAGLLLADPLPEQSPPEAKRVMPTETVGLESALNQLAETLNHPRSAASLGSKSGLLWSRSLD